LRLLHRGQWWGTTARYALCVQSGCITLPRQIDSVLSAAIDNQPIKIRNEWFEYLSAGYGIRDSSSTSLQLLARGTAPVFRDIQGTNRIIRAYIDNPNDAGKTITLKGYDENGQWILTNNGATDGHRLTLAPGYVSTPAVMTALSGVIKEETLGAVRLYEYNPDTLELFAMAVYEPDETVPSYLRFALPYAENSGDSQTLNCMVKLSYIPAAKDTDFLLIGNLPALKEMCQAIRYYETDSIESARKGALHERRAVEELEKELAHHRGPVNDIPICVDPDTHQLGNIAL
jgi:hypothetical protein